jgi:hypothetical protein
MRKPLVLAAAALGALAVVGIGIAGLNGNTSVHLSSQLEVPVCCDSQAQGQAIFHVARDGDSIDYKLIVANIDNAFMAHIHLGRPGGTGQIGVWLFPSTTPGVTGPLGAGRMNGPIAEGTITRANLVGPLAGKSIADLVTLLDEGGAYVNVHTNDGVTPATNTPGDIPSGEIRADLG